MNISRRIARALGVAIGSAALVAAGLAVPLPADAYTQDTVPGDKTGTGNITVERHWGASSVDTAVAVSKAGWTTSDWVVLATGNSFPDGLAGGPLAYQLGAPILLTKAGATGRLEAAVADEIRRLGATHAAILGGEGVVGPTVVDGLVGLGIPRANIDRRGGATMYDTSLLIAERVRQLQISKGKTPPQEFILATGSYFADALSVSPAAALLGEPILFAKSGNLLDANTLKYITETIKPKTAIIVGGSGVVSDAVEQQVAGLCSTASNPVTRLWGATMYDTSLSIVKYFKAKFTNKDGEVTIATGTGFPDALGAAPFAAKLGTPLFLLPGGTTTLNTKVRDALADPSYKKAHVLGGTGALADPLVSSHLNGIPVTTAATSGTSLRVSWAAVPGATGYRVMYSAKRDMSSPSHYPPVTTAPTTATSVTLSGLAYHTRYFIQVVALKPAAAAADQRQLTRWVYGVTPAMGVTSLGSTSKKYSTPTGLSVGAVTSTTIGVSWTGITSSPGYIIKYTSAADGTQYAYQYGTMDTLGDTLREPPLVPLLKYTTYSISVAVYDDTNHVVASNFSKAITVRTSNFDIAAPTGLSVSGQTSSTATLTWTAPAGVPAGYKYQVWYSTSSNMSGQKSGGTFASGPARVSGTVTGLADTTTYYMRVDVVSPTGTQKGDYSAILRVLTTPARGVINGKVTGAPYQNVLAMAYATGTAVKRQPQLVQQVEVATDGSYSLSVPPGTYRVKLNYLGTAGYTSMWANGTAGGTMVSGNATYYAVAVDRTVSAGTTNLVVGASVSGVVKSSSGSPVGGVYVSSLTADNTAREAEQVTYTASNGAFTIMGLPAGQHWLRFAKPGSTVFSINVLVASSSGLQVTHYRMSTLDPWQPWTFGKNLVATVG